MNKKNYVNFEEMDKKLNGIVKNIDPSIKQYFKQFFEKNLLYFYNGKLELSLIVDANIIIQETISYIRNNKSFLLELSESPFIKLLAPLKLKEELENKKISISKEKKVNEDKIKEVFDLFSKKITFVEIEDRKYKIGLDMIGRRDKQDVHYVACYLSIKSHGIMTRDKDILDIPEIKTWERPGLAGKVVTVFENGAFSFFLLGEGLPQVCKLLYEMLVLLLRSVWEVICIIANLICNLIKEGIATISKFPDWAKILIGIGVLFLIIEDRSREFIKNVLQSFVQGIVDILEQFYDATKDILTWIAPLIETGICLLCFLLCFLFIKVEETIRIYKQINQ